MSSTQPLTLSAVIPTRNRPIDLVVAVKSILQQTRIPNELIIIDQSLDEQSKTAVLKLIGEEDTPLKVTYILDSKIKGLVAAKNHSLAFTSGDIVSFLEDDIELLPDYFHNVERLFLQHPQVRGCGGVVTEVAGYSDAYRRYFRLTHRGIFFDQRVEMHARTELPSQLVTSRYISGGVSSYRREVFEQIPFDTLNGFFALEDIEFSTRAADCFGDEHFCIAPNIRLKHHVSPANRAVLGTIWERKLREYVLFYKKHSKKQGSSIDLAILLLALLVSGIITSMRARKIDPLIGYWKGVINGFKQKLLPLNKQGV